MTGASLDLKPWYRMSVKHPWLTLVACLAIIAAIFSRVAVQLGGGVVAGLVMAALVGIVEPGELGASAPGILAVISIVTIAVDPVMCGPGHMWAPDSAGGCVEAARVAVHA